MSFDPKDYDHIVLLVINLITSEDFEKAEKKFGKDAKHWSMKIRQWIDDRSFF